MRCIFCNKVELSGRQKLYCSMRCNKRDWKHKNIEKNRQSLLDGAQRRLNRLRAHTAKAKDVPCHDCGVKYPYYVMDFDHVRGVKVGNISQLLRYGIAVVDAEIKKCEVVCANCHRQRTHKRLVG